MNPVSIGVVGCGVIGNVHLRYASEWEGAKVVAVADLREQAAREAAEKFGVGRVYPDADALFADREVEGVVLAMPTGGRTQVALRALAHGKHVLLEKPVAMNASEVRELMAARGDRVVACCSSRHRFQESCRVATQVVSSGALGPLRVVYCRAVKGAGPPSPKPPPPWRVSKSKNGGGILVNWGCYDLDYLLGITGWKLKPEWVLAQTWPVPPVYQARVAEGSDAETHFATLIRCQEGTVISFERAEFATLQSEEAWRIVGTNGSLRLHMTQGKDKKVFLDQADEEKGLISKVIWEGDEELGPVHTGVLADFAGAIREQRPPDTSLEKALVVQQITDAIYRSAEEGHAVNIEEER